MPLLVDKSVSGKGCESLILLYLNPNTVEELNAMPGIGAISTYCAILFRWRCSRVFLQAAVIETRQG